MGSIYATQPRLSLRALSRITLPFLKGVALRDGMGCGLPKGDGPHLDATWPRDSEPKTAREQTGPGWALSLRILAGQEAA